MSTAVTWPVFQSALLSREMVAERTMSFRFAKPARNLSRWRSHRGTRPACRQHRGRTQHHDQSRHPSVHGSPFWCAPQEARSIGAQDGLLVCPARSPVHRCAGR
jgi:hypothetical protein